MKADSLSGGEGGRSEAGESGRKRGRERGFEVLWL